MEYQSFKIFDQEAENIVAGLRVADCMNLQEFEEESNDYDETTMLNNLKELAVSDVLTCSYCNVSFVDVSQQRNHFKLDWHRYNLKRALTGNKSVSEEIYNTLADEILYQISESESDKSDNSENETSPIVENSENFKGKFKSYRHAKAFFENHENKIFSVYRCLLHSKKETLVKEELVKRVHDLIKQPRKWMIILLGGGHFASGIFNDGEILQHKTFHCYTVRAKQGGSQSTRDNKGGSHPKSAGASLRRYNEQALVQHVQEITTSWSDHIKQCSLILYRATGPYNRGVLFRGKDPAFLKTDQRLRNIPFPTKRATFTEVKRVYDMLSNIEIYGAAENYKFRFPTNPDKRTFSPKSKKESSSEPEEKEQQFETDKKSPKKFPEKARSSPLKEISEQNIQTASSESEDEEDEDESNVELVSSDVTVCFQDLAEYEDTVPEFIKELKRNSNLKQKKKRKKISVKKKTKSDRSKWNDTFEQLQSDLVKSCENEDKKLLLESLNMYAELPEKEPVDAVEVQKTCVVFTKEDFINCLNSPTEKETKNTILHLAAIKGLPEFVTLLLTSGADPAVRNKNKLTPYVIGDKETRNSFRSFAASFPDKYDYKNANIPEPLTDEKAKEIEEKKKEKKKLKRMKEKIKKQEDKEKRNEEEEKRKFLALSDREKCALAAERRIVASSTSNLKSSKPPVLSRCFQCGVDISGIVAFEYEYNRFCTIPCLKAHRLKTKSYGKEI